MIGKDSRYAKSVLYTGGGEEFLGRARGSILRLGPTTGFHTVVEGERIDLIAHRYLGDAALWWIVCDYNDIFYPLDLEVGAMLRIPALEYVQCVSLFNSARLIHLFEGRPIQQSASILHFFHFLPGTF